MHRAAHRVVHAAHLRDVEVRGSENYGSSYKLRFDARSDDTIHVWMYSPATPGYVVIDDVTLMLNQPISITDGEWVITLTAVRSGDSR